MEPLALCIAVDMYENTMRYRCYCHRHHHCHPQRLYLLVVPLPYIKALSNIVLQWLVFMLHILEFSSSFLPQEDIYPDKFVFSLRNIGESRVLYSGI